MLRTPAPFPNVGSWALLDDGGTTRAVRILERSGPDALISIGGGFSASANRRLPISSLQNADPLSGEEQAELEKIERRMAGKARPRKADVDRSVALGQRTIHARTLQEILSRLPARHFPAAAAARVAERRVA